MSTTLLKYVADKIKEERTRLSDDLSLGKGKDFGDYKYAAGIIRGLDIVTSILIVTSERMKVEDDE